MAGILSKMFPALFSNPEEEAMKRKMRVNSTLHRYEQEIRKQDGFIKKYLSQAVSTKRTGDAANLAQVKKALKRTFAFRKRVQSLYNSLQLFSTMADQMAAYHDFCASVKDITEMIGGGLHAEEVFNAQKNLQEGMMKAKSAEDLIDQTLAVFDDSFTNLSEGESVSNAIPDDTLENMIDQLVTKQDSLTEDNISRVLNGAVL